jgi:hypothetical protein
MPASIERPRPRTLGLKPQKGGLPAGVRPHQGTHLLETGEAVRGGTTPALAAVINAVVDALAELTSNCQLPRA